LQIDAHCPGDTAKFRKTKAMLEKVKSQAIGGNLEMGETVALRFIPDKSEDSADWVDDMNRDIFYRYTGNLTFETAEEAENAWRKFTSVRLNNILQL
jgi:hypothetical protein